MRGEIRAAGTNQVQATLRRQGVTPTKIKKRRSAGGSSIKPKDMAIFTRQLATMMKAGVPLLQAFDIVGRGNPNPVSPSCSTTSEPMSKPVPRSVSRSASTRSTSTTSIATWSRPASPPVSSISYWTASRSTWRRPEAIKSKIKSALMYPISVLVVAFVVVSVIMIFVIPAFKRCSRTSGGELPGPTLIVIAMSEFFVKYWYLIFGGLAAGSTFSCRPGSATRRSRTSMDRVMLKLPIFGTLVEKSCIARWTRTLSTMFAAGVPLVEALDSVGGAAGNSVFGIATVRIQQEVSTGTALTVAMTNANLFPSMVLQMCAIGEESGSIDHMLGKAADFYESEVDDMVAGISSLMEPIIIVVLGTIIGGIVVAMYLPIFKLGAVV